VVTADEEMGVPLSTVSLCIGLFVELRSQYDTEAEEENRRMDHMVY
jgi:hypothetical protein